MPKVSYLGEEIETEASQSSQAAESEFWQQERESLNASLQSELATLEREGENKALLLLRFGLGFSEASIGACLGVNQATISRHLSQRLRQLLKVALEWLQARLEIDEQTLVQTNAYMTLWLQQHYQLPLNSLLRDRWRDRLSEEQKQLLRLRYFETLTESQIARQQQRSSAEIREAIAAAKDCLFLEVLDWVETTLNLKLPGQRERKRIAKAIEKWLTHEQATQ